MDIRNSKIAHIFRKISGWFFLVLVFLGIIFGGIYLYTQAYYTQSSLLQIEGPSIGGEVRIHGYVEIFTKEIFTYPIALKIPYEKQILCTNSCPVIHIPRGKYTLETNNWKGYKAFSGGLQIQKNTKGSLDLGLEEIFPITPYERIQEQITQEQEIREQILQSFPRASSIDVHPFDSIAIFKDANESWNIYNGATKTRYNTLLTGEQIQHPKYIGENIYSVQVDGIYTTIDIQTQTITTDTTKIQHGSGIFSVKDRSGNYLLLQDGTIMNEEETLFIDYNIRAIYSQDDQLIIQKRDRFFLLIEGTAQDPTIDAIDRDIE